MRCSKAQALLEEFWDLKLPIDPKYFAKQFGLRVILNKDLGLKSGYLDQEKKEIHVNSNESQQRQRFTIAHELGHYCLGHGSSFRDTSNLEWINKTFDPKKERAANQFAADLLMPAIAVKILVDKRQIKDAKELRKIFDVSPQALYCRLDSLGYFL